jgi:HAE1 family hydrophobic/amphiphilic exporter-1
MKLLSYYSYYVLNGCGFIPVAFMSGPVGVFYRQFAITMATAIILSGIVALLTPALCAIMLRNNHGKAKRKLL